MTVPCGRTHATTTAQPASILASGGNKISKMKCGSSDPKNTQIQLFILDWRHSLNPISPFWVQVVAPSLDYRGTPPLTRGSCGKVLSMLAEHGTSNQNRLTPTTLHQMLNTWRKITWMCDSANMMMQCESSSEDSHRSPGRPCGVGGYNSVKSVA